MKVVVNRCFGGFGLSDEAFKLYCERMDYAIVGNDRYFWAYKELPYNNGKVISYDSSLDRKLLSSRDIERNDPILVSLVEEMGDKVNTRFSQLEVVQIPNDVEWEISEYDGREHIAEKHRTW